MEISEKKIEDLIVRAIQERELSKLIERGLTGFDFYDLLFRQVDLGVYGRLDLVAVKYDLDKQVIGKCKCFYICVIEIKKREINYNTFLQAIRYCKGIETYLESIDMKANFNIKLIGSSVCKSDFIYITDFFENLDLYTIDLNLDTGIFFNKQSGYSQTNDDFDISESIQDTIRNYVQNQIRRYVNYDKPF